MAASAASWTALTDEERAAQNSAVEEVVRRAEVAADGEDLAGVHSSLGDLEELALARVRLLTPPESPLDPDAERDLDAFLRHGVHRQLAQAFFGRSDGEPPAVAGAFHALCGALAAGRAPGEAPYTGIAVFGGLAGGSEAVGAAAQAAADALADAVAPPDGKYALGEWWTAGAAARRAHDERLALDVWNADKSSQAAAAEYRGETVYPATVYLPILELQEDVLAGAEAMLPGSSPLPDAHTVPPPGSGPEAFAHPVVDPAAALDRTHLALAEGFAGRAEGEAGGEEPLVLTALEKLDAVAAALVEGGDSPAAMADFAAWLKGPGPEGRAPFRPAAAAAAGEGGPAPGTAESVGPALLAAYEGAFAADLAAWRADLAAFPADLARDIAGLASAIKAAGDGRGAEHTDPIEFLRGYLAHALRPAFEAAAERAGAPGVELPPEQAAAKAQREAAQTRAEVAAVRRIAEALAGDNDADPVAEEPLAGREAVLAAMEGLADVVDPGPVPRPVQRAFDERILAALEECVEEASEAGSAEGPALKAAFAELAAAAEARFEAASGEQLSDTFTARHLVTAVLYALANPVSPLHRTPFDDMEPAKQRLYELSQRVEDIVALGRGLPDLSLQVLLYVLLHRLPEAGFGPVGPLRDVEAAQWSTAAAAQGAAAETKESLESAAAALDGDGDDDLLAGDGGGLGGGPDGGDGGLDGGLLGGIPLALL